MSIETLVGTVRPHVLEGSLQLVVLTGCCTSNLAAALVERARVPHVLYAGRSFSVMRHGRIFGTAFAEANGF